VDNLILLAIKYSVRPYVLLYIAMSTDLLQSITVQECRPQSTQNIPVFQASRLI